MPGCLVVAAAAGFVVGLVVIAWRLVGLLVVMTGLEVAVLVVTTGLAVVACLAPRLTVVASTFWVGEAGFAVVGLGVTAGFLVVATAAGLGVVA